ncbi:MAG: hypothetical protein H5T73_10810 [Actinobacteria bacterium]|nr:hypothetical protein [Actinomycetota bacterium]
MPYEDLLRQRAIEPADVGREEIVERLRVARRDLAVSADVAPIDRDWAFNIAYNGILQASIAYMNFLGYRPRGEGKHMNVFRFMAEALPDELRSEMDRVQKMRQKRNRAVYGTRGMVSRKEVEHILEFARNFIEEIIYLLPRSYSKLLG